MTRAIPKLLAILTVFLIGCSNDTDGLLYTDYVSVLDCYHSETGFSGLPARSSDRTTGEERLAKVIMESCQDLF